MSIQRPALPQPIETILQDKKPCQRHTAFLEFYITFCAQVYSAAHVPVHKFAHMETLLSFMLRIHLRCKMSTEANARCFCSLTGHTCAALVACSTI